ncbi:hypothetical protein E2C01_093016 [Portunus trituberculatus]|uniref:Uncharacterized protein n=1 Tax=Portunus trituberculatus TaxID=210409 RepID=A0A5B7JLR7_PORTR|nr:hypothetical protein [Portunus trituberculatus]
MAKRVKWSNAHKRSWKQMQEVEEQRRYKERSGVWWRDKELADSWGLWTISVVLFVECDGKELRGGRGGRKGVAGSRVRQRHKEVGNASEPVHS